MTNCLRCLTTLISVAYLSQVAAPMPTWAEGKDDGPQGRYDKTTPLANGLTGNTTAQFSQGGLQLNTTVQIPVAGVYETRNDGATNIQITPGRTTPGSTARGSVPPSNGRGGEDTRPAPRCCGDWIVGGGPLSYETGPDGTQNQFGGFAIGGFDFVNVTPGVTRPGGQTTPWRAVGQVIQLDPRTLALNVENQLGFPPIVLKANPDPGLAQLESWFWAANYDGAVRTRSGTQSETHTQCRLNNGNLECVPVTNTVTVDVRERPTLYAWDFGDARTAQDGHPATFTTSTGLGRAYMDPYSPSPVLHKYVLSSLKFFDAGGYPIALRITWDADFRVNGGPWQDLGPVTGTFSSRHQVRESWPVGVNNTTTIGTAP
jgi:hypothetical protein